MLTLCLAVLAALPARADLITAAKSGNVPEISRFLKAGANVDSHIDVGTTALMFAILNEHDDAAIALIKAGANVNARTKQGLTPLMLAGVHGRDMVARELLRAGADVKATDETGMTALWTAVAWNHSSAAQIESLIKAGSDVNAKGPPKGTTVLMNAAAHCEPEATKALIKAGAKIDSWGAGWTPLMHAAANGCAATVKILLAAGADARLKDDKGRTARDVAKENHPEILAAFRAGR